MFLYELPGKAISDSIKVKAGGELAWSLVVAEAGELEGTYLGTLEWPPCKDISHIPPVNLTCKPGFEEILTPS